MLIASDTEVPGLDLRRGLKPFMVSACDENLRPRVWEWSVNSKTREVNVNGIDVVEICDYFAGNEIIFHHSQFDLCALANIGIRLQCDGWTVPESPYAKSSRIVPVKAIHETLFASHLVDSRGVYKPGGKTGAKSTHALKELCLVRLNVSDADEVALKKAVNRARNIADKLGWKKGEEPGHDYWLPKALFDARHGQTASFDDIDIPLDWEHLCRSYSTCDVRERTLQLFYVCREILQSDGRWEMYLNELPLLRIFYNIEHNGIRLDPERTKQQIAVHKRSAAEHEKQCQQIARKPKLNLNSPIQLRELLFDQWELKSSYRTPKGNQLSTNAKVLEELRDYLAYKQPRSHKEEQSLTFITHLIGKKNYETNEVTPGLRQHLKMLGYLESYQTLQIKDRLHPTIHAVGTGTTRISNSNPNGQNVSAKKIDGISLRTAFGPAPGHIWASVDYEQLELRIFAALAQDHNLIESFEHGYDFHSFVASRIFNLSPEKISKEQRRIAKNTNFCIIFGGSPAKTDYTAGMPGAYAAFAKQFPSAKQFMDRTLREVAHDGFIPTADGYPLYAPPGEPFKAVDYRVQGTAGRIIKLAMRWLCEGREDQSVCHCGDLIKDHKIYGSCTTPRSMGGSEPITPIINWQDVSIVVQIHDELVFDIDVRKRSRKNTVRLLRQIMMIMEEAGQSMGIVTPVEGKIHPNNWADGISVREYLAC